MRPAARRRSPRIRIEDGTIVLRDQANKTVETLSNVEFALAWPSISRSFAGTGGFTWRHEQVAASISFTDFAAALQGDRSGFKVRLAGAPLKFAFDGYVSHRPTLKMEGTLAADAVSLREALRWAGQQPPSGGGLGRFAIKAQTNVVAGTIGFSRAHVELDGNVGEGVLAFDGRQTLQGTLATEALDLTPYVSTVRLLSGGERGERGWDGNPIALNGFDGMDVDLRLSAARVTIANAKLGRTAVAATLRGGHFTVAIGESEAFGGVVKGTLGIAKSAAGADLKAQLQFSNVELEQCMGELLGIRRLEGEGNLAFSIESSGASVYALAKALNGTATLSSRKGAIAGSERRATARRIERKPLSGGGDFRVGKTPYETLTVNLKIVNGVANVEDVRMEGAVVGLGLSGTASNPCARSRSARDSPACSSANATAARACLRIRAALHGARTMERPHHAAGSAKPDRALRRSRALLDAMRNRGTADAVRSVIERLRGRRQRHPPAPTAAAPALAGSPCRRRNGPGGASPGCRRQAGSGRVTKPAIIERAIDDGRAGDGRLGATQSLRSSFLKRISGSLLRVCRHCERRRGFGCFAACCGRFSRSRLPRSLSAPCSPHFGITIDQIMREVGLSQQRVMELAERGLTWALPNLPPRPARHRADVVPGLAYCVRPARAAIDRTPPYRRSLTFVLPNPAAWPSTTRRSPRPPRLRA